MAFGYSNDQYQRQNNSQHKAEGKPIKWAWEDFPLNHLLKISLVFQERDKGYKSPFYAFFSVWPMGNGTYIQDKQIPFMLELPKLRAIGKALRLAAHGAIPKDHPFKNYADSSKAAVRGKDTEDRSSKMIQIYTIPGPVISVSLSLNRGKLKGGQQGQGGYQQNNQGPGQSDSKSYGNVGLKLNQAEALMVADYIEFLSDEGRKQTLKFRSESPLYVINKKIGEMRARERQKNQQNSSTQGASQQAYQEMPQQNNQEIPDQAKLRQQFSFLPEIPNVFFDTFRDENGNMYLRANGDTDNNIYALRQSGFVFTEHCPFWWKAAA